MIFYIFDSLIFVLIITLITCLKIKGTFEFFITKADTCTVKTGFQKKYTTLTVGGSLVLIYIMMNTECI